MLSLYQISLIICFSAVHSEGKIKNNEKTLPIEVVLNDKIDGEVPTPESTYLKNKAIELKFLSDDNKGGGKIDLIIQATKEIQSTERKIDRYSPVFNSEFRLNSELPGNTKSGFKLNRNWDASRQDSHIHYPSDGMELFPLIMLREILQAPHPLMGQNQFAPTQNLRHFEDNLRKEIMPFQQGWEPASKLPMQLAVSQPILTRGVSPTLNQQHLPQSPNFLYMLQNGLLQNYNLPHNFHQTNNLGNNLPANGYSHTPSTLQSGYLTNINKNNNLLNISPQQHDPKSQHLQPSPKSNLPTLQTIPNILGHNKTPLPVNNQPGYHLQRNLQNVNSPVQKQLYPQTTLPFHADHLHSTAKLHNQGGSNYEQNRESQLANYKPVITSQPNQNSYHNPVHPEQNREAQLANYKHIITPQPNQNLYRSSAHHQYPQPYHQQTFPDIRSPNLNTYSNNQQYAHQQRSALPIDPQKNTYRENYKPLLREPPLHSQSLNDQNLHHKHHGHTAPQSLPNDYRNHALNNEPVYKISENDKKIPIYYRSPEGSRTLHYQPQSGESPDSQRYTTTDQSYSRSSSLSSSSSPNQDHYYSEPETAHRNTYQEPHYRSHTRSSSDGIEDSVNKSDENNNPESSKYDDSYVSSKPIKKRKSRKKKRYETKENMEDLDGHSSHQYIIKIG